MRTTPVSVFIRTAVMSGNPTSIAVHAFVAIFLLMSIIDLVRLLPLW
jgi:hypothetical protein